ncbi:MAG TPA: serine/threonine-protein kinase, partial [Planctomycetota bacterium]|nr:serine/threonine-protein kinase [Planctomycetota bacterium]
MPADEWSDLQDLLARYVDRLNEGQRFRREDILAEHPVHGPELVEHLESFLEHSVATGENERLGTLGDYTLLRQLGRGGMGVVYEAWQGSLDRRVALKVLPAGIAADNRAFLRFMKEAKTAAQLNHQNVVAVYGMGVEQNTPYFSMELVEGETLAQVLVKIKEVDDNAMTPFGKKGELAFYSNLANAFADVADGLQHAHSKKVIHRDIKPSNLILDREGRLRILDFGL